MRSLTVFLGRWLESLNYMKLKLKRNLNMPMPFLVLDMAYLIWVEKDNFESRTSPKCLCSTTCITGKLLKGISG